MASTARPLFWLTAAFMLGIAAARLFEGALPKTEYFAPAALALIAILAIPAIFPRFADHPFFFAVPASLFVLFGIWAAQSASQPSSSEKLQPFFNRAVSYVAEVAAPPEYYPDKIRIPLLLISALEDGKKTGLEAGALLTVYKSPGAASSFWLPGDRFLGRMTLKPFRSFRNPGGFDYVRYQAERGLYAQSNLDDERFLTRLAPESRFSPVSALISVRGRIDRFRQQALSWLQETLDPDPAAFYAALLLGYQHFLDRNRQEQINRTGLNHLLSISGVHLGLVSLLVFCLVRFFIRYLHPTLLNRVSDKQIAVWPALACAVLYALLAGFGVPPIWRSILMLTVCFGAAFWYRSPDPLTVLAFAALLILIFDPNSLWQITFQLTFACVLAIILIFPKFRALRLSRLHPAIGPKTIAGRVLSQFEDAFWISIAVNAMVLPLTIFYFNGFSLAGFAANIVLVPYVGFIILPWGLFSLALFSVSETLAYPFIKAGEWLLAPCLRLIEWFSGFSWSYFWTGSMPVVWLFSIYAGLGLLFLPLSRKIRFGCLGALVAFLCGFAAWNIHADAKLGAVLRVDSIDVGQGTSTLIRFPSGETMLVDGGGFQDDSFDIGRMVLAPFLWHEGIRGIDHLVVSHDHPDHRNGLRFILSNFDTGMFWTSRITEAGFEGKNTPPGLDEIASKRDIRVRTFPELLEDVRIGQARVRVCHPRQKFLEQGPRGPLNDYSLVLEIGFGDTSLILPGDIGQKVEDSIAAEFEANRQVLLVSPHHGSGFSNGEKLLDTLRPQAIIFSCGFGNIFGFPAQAALQRCAQRNIPIYRTDLDGAVRAISDGHRWTVTAK